MYENDDKKRSFDCDNNINQTSRPKRMRIEGFLIDSLYTKESKLNNLGSNCFHHILSFLTYDKVSQIRQVCKAFNETGKRLLAKGHRELERRLKGEIERAKNRVLFPTNIRSSYDTILFLKTLDRAIYDCTISYKYHIDYFVVGKLLDEANSLLENFNGLTVLPYFSEHACHQKVHPLLASIITHSNRAKQHFWRKLLKKFIHYDLEAALDGEEQNTLEIVELREQNEMRIIKTNLLKLRMQKIDCGNNVSREFIKLMVKLNESLLILIPWAKNVDEKVERVINGKDLLDNKGVGNCLFQLSSPSSWSPKKAAEMIGIQVSSKRPNLATLPLTCIQNIVSYFNCDKIAQLRTICESFKEASKKELNQKFENVKQKLEFQIKTNDIQDMQSGLRQFYLRTNIMKNICSFLQLCKDNYKFHLGNNYYFAAGKLLDEAKHVIYTNRGQPGYYVFHHVDRDYEFQPHYLLFHLMDLAYKAFAHFKFNIVPKYLPSTQNHTYVPDFIISGFDRNLGKECQANIELEEVEKLIEEANVRIKKQNVKNKKFITIISSLKEKVFILNKEVYEKINLLKKLE